jgi:O-antigen ligase
VQSPSGPGFDHGAHTSLAGFALLVLATCLGWRWPTFLWLVALASLAVRPEGAFDLDVEMGYEWGVQHWLIALALVASALRHGIVWTVNWPILALTVTFALSLLFGDLHAELTFGLMLMSLALLALPFAFTQVQVAPGSRDLCVRLIALAPLASVAAGWLLGLDSVQASAPFRLKGATGNAAIFAALAFAGLTVALHEATRPGRAWLAWLAVVNLALVILSGSRTAMLASLLFLAVYAFVSSELRKIVRDHSSHVLIGGCILGAVIVWYFPALQDRIWSDGGVRPSGRANLWSFYLDEFLVSPIFGRGFGSGFKASADWLEFYPTPHNEYLHLLVTGGVVGFVLCMTGIVLWFHHLFTAAPPHDRRFLLAVGLALAIYAITDNLLTYPGSLALFAYLGALLTWSAAAEPQATDRRSGKDSVERRKNRSHA